ncbi:MAG: hypothetical protein QM504_03400 [Pseudomonadota bacterium]
MTKSNWRSTLSGFVRKGKPINLDDDWKKAHIATKAVNLVLPVKGIREKVRSLSEKYHFRKELFGVMFGAFKAFLFYAYETFALIFTNKTISKSTAKDEVENVFDEDTKLAISKQSIKLIAVWLLTFFFWLSYLRNSYVNTHTIPLLSSAHLIFWLISFYLFIYIKKQNIYSGRFYDALRFYMCFFLDKDDFILILSRNKQKDFLSEKGSRLFLYTFVFMSLFTIVILGKLVFDYIVNSYFSGLLSFNTIVLFSGAFLTYGYGKLYRTYR